MKKRRKITIYVVSISLLAILLLHGASKLFASLESDKMFILYDSSSLGYDIRDFEVAKNFIESNVGKHFLIYTDWRNIDLFSNSLKSRAVIFEGYSKGNFSQETLRSLAEKYQIQDSHIIGFPDLYSDIPEGLKLKSGTLKPDPDPYLDPPQSLVSSYRSFLDDLAAEYEGYRVVYAIVSGLKPVSDIGETPDEQQLEGLRQTYPFEEISRVISSTEDTFAKENIALIAISAQYGEPKEISDVVQKVNKEKDLKFPIQFFDFVDWSDRPDQQAAMFQAIHGRAQDLELPSVAFGNASTYQHLIVAATGGFDINAIAIDSYYKPPQKDGRIYWKELADGALPGLKVFQQKADSPGTWESVTHQLTEYVKQRILTYVSQPNLSYYSKPILTSINNS